MPSLRGYATTDTFLCSLAPRKGTRKGSWCQAEDYINWRSARNLIDSDEPNLRFFVVVCLLPSLEVRKGFPQDQNKSNKTQNRSPLQFLSGRMRFRESLRNPHLGFHFDSLINNSECQANIKQEKPNDCGTRAADVLANFWAGQL